MAAPPLESMLVARFRGTLASEPGPFGLAVSGGPDSLALLLLAAASFPGRVRAATVDHRLRAESAAEAAFVEGVCRDLGVPHAILVPDAPIRGNIQSAARATRYALLADWARREGIACLLTGHHADDQAETLLMRLNRGAGLAGLAGIRAATMIAGVRVLRPLLGWRRGELAAICAAAGLEPVDDPSNADPRYDRVRLRAALAGAPWLDAGALARSAAALAEAGEALDWAVEGLIAERVQRAGEAVSFDPEGVPAELRRRILLHILAPESPPRGPELQRLLATLEAGGTATLAGMKCEGSAVWRFSPAPPRRGD